MTAFRYVIVPNSPDKRTQTAAEYLLTSFEEGYMILSQTPTDASVHYVLIQQDISDALAAGHELDEEDLKVIEDNIDIAMKDIKKRNG